MKRLRGPGLRLDGLNDGTAPWKWAKAAEMRREPTPGERTVGGVLCRLTTPSGELLFARQVPCLGYILDFYSPTARLCVEVDGGSHVSKAAEDRARDAVLEGHGITTVRLTEVAVTTDSGVALDAVVAALKRLGVPFVVGPRLFGRGRRKKRKGKRRGRGRAGKVSTSTTQTPSFKPAIVVRPRREGGS